MCAVCLLRQFRWGRKTAFEAQHRTPYVQPSTKNQTAKVFALMKTAWNGKQQQKNTATAALNGGLGGRQAGIQCDDDDDGSGCCICLQQYAGIHLTALFYTNMLVWEMRAFCVLVWPGHCMNSFVVSRIATQVHTNVMRLHFESKGSIIEQRRRRRRMMQEGARRSKGRGKQWRRGGWEWEEKTIVRSRNCMERKCAVPLSLMPLMSDGL